MEAIILTSIVHLARWHVAEMIAARSFWSFTNFVSTQVATSWKRQCSWQLSGTHNATIQAHQTAKAVTADTACACSIQQLHSPSVLVSLRSLQLHGTFSFHRFMESRTSFDWGQLCSLATVQSRRAGSANKCKHFTRAFIILDPRIFLSLCTTGFLHQTQIMALVRTCR